MLPNLETVRRSGTTRNISRRGTVPKRPRAPVQEETCRPRGRRGCHRPVTGSKDALRLPPAAPPGPRGAICLFSSPNDISCICCGGKMKVIAMKNK
ncbi:hypothetical protein NDU88_000927 [Pleurodeles waltl]|uniref:Uncharacterized protein n=1 Tax=Pleurodeles waltl TaxID=8319 RepID=A0AAV7U550_PLEWA|nr:hypothetical protein NDU88_000927 [Pleurodeles waltl]